MSKSGNINELFLFSFFFFLHGLNLNVDSCSVKAELIRQL